MKIAITSCVNILLFQNQAVWRSIVQRRPDVLVLLGDSVYYDIPWAKVGLDDVHPSDLTPAQFLQHGVQLYNSQLTQEDFRAAVRTVPRSYAIWDDHDFLWNGAAGDALSPQIYGEHIRASRALFKAYREALAARSPEGFPADAADSRLNRPYEPAPGYSAVDLDADTCLHLTDGRSFRNKYHLLGSAQRAQITEEMQKRPNAVHLVASGIVFGGQRGERWSGFAEDYDWMINMARQFRIVVLSGDVHENRMPAALQVPGGRNLFEITSSGAAIRRYVTFGAAQQNFGIVDIGGGKVALTTHEGPSATVAHSATIDIASWS